MRECGLRIRWVRDHTGATIDWYRVVCMVLPVASERFHNRPHSHNTLNHTTPRRNLPHMTHLMDGWMDGRMDGWTAQALEMEELYAPELVALLESVNPHFAAADPNASGVVSPPDFIKVCPLVSLRFVVCPLLSLRFVVCP